MCQFCVKYDIVSSVCQSCVSMCQFCVKYDIVSILCQVCVNHVSVCVKHVSSVCHGASRGSCMYQLNWSRMVDRLLSFTFDMKYSRDLSVGAFIEGSKFIHLRCAWHSSYLRECSSCL